MHRTIRDTPPSRGALRALALTIIVSIIVTAALPQDKGTVYIVYGSDTAIWDGMSTSTRFPTYRLSLFTSPTGNAAKIMSPEVRNAIRDSYGTPLIMTWWMMAGNIFRDATNTNMPYPNIMTMYLMRGLYGDALNSWGDELSLHYHTFFWSDYDGDGRFWWNQAETFNESRDDWEFTIAQLLIEEDVFPVSFRSGWHFMDNAWQQRLDDLLPYSMHNAYPSKRLTDTEPTDNVIDWSRAPSTWVPYHPDPNDYQVPGPGKGWNLRSISMGGATQAKIEPAFIEANAGNDQILCIWDHLPDANFFTYLTNANAILDTLAAHYPGVPFRFVTAVEGMRLFLRSADSTAPATNVMLVPAAGGADVVVETNEPIFQTVPYVAVKTRGEEYYQVPMELTGPLQWTSVASVDTGALARMSVALTDTVGNQTRWSRAFVPADFFLDDTSPGFSEDAGVWTTVASTTWGTTSKRAAIAGGDSARASWMANITQSLPYAVRLQVPPVAAPCSSYALTITEGTTVRLDTVLQSLEPDAWIDGGAYTFNAGSEVHVSLTGYAPASGADLGVDVVRITPLVPQYKTLAGMKAFSLGFRSLGDSIRIEVPVRNVGLSAVTIASVSGSDLPLMLEEALPLAIAPGGAVSLTCLLVPDALGSATDTITVAFAEAQVPALQIPVTMSVEREVHVVDNDEGTGYAETGTWQTSVVTSYGSTSRYSILTPSGGQYAEFSTRMRSEGYYRVSFLIPSSENATDRALHRLSVGPRIVGSVYLSQRPGGTWTDIGTFRLPADSTVTLRVANVGGYTSGLVLRADAVKFSRVEVTPQASYIADNDSAELYQESGTWRTSNAQAYGPSSRFTFLSEGPGQYARFRFQVWEDGLYDVQYIVPTTVNAATGARYRLIVDGTVAKELIRNQNVSSGSWVSLGTYALPAFGNVEVEVSNDSAGPANIVLRADAVRAVRVVTSVRDRAEEGVPLTFGLSQAFPNPFNATTTLVFSLPQTGESELVIHDILGRVVKRVLTGTIAAGEHVVRWHGDTEGGEPVPSGVYLVRLIAGDRSAVRKVMLIR